MAADSSATARIHLADAGLMLCPKIGMLPSLEVFQTTRVSVGVMYPGDHVPDGVPLIKAGDLNGSIINPRSDFNQHEKDMRIDRRWNLQEAW